MSKSSFIAALLLAIVAHAILLFPWNRQTIAPARPAPPKPVALTPAPTPEPQPHAPRYETVSAPQPPLDLLEVVRASGEVQPALDGDSAERDDDTVPPLTIVWNNPDHLAAVARAVGLRVLGVDASQQIVAEVSLDGPPRYIAFRGELGGFSNRIRTLAPSFLRLPNRTAEGAAVASLWILVPADEDARIVTAQREALAAERLPADEVWSMEARFDQSGSGHTLVVTAIHHGS